jgi:DNA-3-methyladenine glycosylase
LKAYRKFFERDVLTVAEELLGNYFIRETKEGRVVGKIVETEGYGNASDLASHARFGKTDRNEVMFGQPGILYVYLIYGIFSLTNIVCGKKDEPSAILIRAAEIIEGERIVLNNLLKNRFVKSNEKLATGPGKFSAAFAIDKSFTGTDLIKSKEVRIELNEKEQDFDIIKRPRIGVEYAGESAGLPWRFYIKDNPFVSKK